MIRLNTALEVETGTVLQYRYYRTSDSDQRRRDWGSRWASAHPGKIRVGHWRAWKFEPWSENFLV